MCSSVDRRGSWCGLAYLKNGEKNQPQLSLQQALKLSPTFEGAEDAKRVLATIKG